MTTSRETFQLIHTYSRAQAIEDGVLIAADSLEEGFSRSCGFMSHVAFTAAAWAEFVAWDEETEGRKTESTGQDPKGRLADVLGMGRLYAIGADGPRVAVPVLRVPPHGESHVPDLATIEMHIGPGDEGEPVFTFMLPGED